jgi:hypothetical protein
VIAETIIHHAPRTPVQATGIPQTPDPTVVRPAQTRGPAHPTPEKFVTTSTGVGARPTREVFVEVEEEPIIVETEKVKVKKTVKVGPKPKVPKSWLQPPVEEVVKETIKEKKPKGYPAAAPAPEGTGPRTYRRWFGSEW